MFEKGKFANDYHPLTIEGKKGKDSLFIDSRPFEYKVAHIDFYGLIFENHPYFDLVNYCSHINVNDVVSKDVMKISSYDMFYNGNSADSVGLVHPVQIVNVCDSIFSRFDLFDYKNSLNSSFCLNVPIQMICDGFEFLKGRMITTSLLDICVKRFLHEVIDLFDFVLQDKSLKFCARFPCFDLSVRAEITMQDCSSICMFKFPLI